MCLKQPNLQCLERVLKCHLRDAEPNLLRIDCLYLTLTLTHSTAAVSRDNSHSRVLLNFNRTELSNPGLILKIKSHKTGWEPCSEQGRSIQLSRGKQRCSSSQLQSVLIAHLAVNELLF